MKKWQVFSTESLKSERGRTLPKGKSNIKIPQKKILSAKEMRELESYIARVVQFLQAKTNMVRFLCFLPGKPVKKKKHK